MFRRVKNKIIAYALIAATAFSMGISFCEDTYSDGDVHGGDIALSLHLGETYELQLPAMVNLEFCTRPTLGYGSFSDEVDEENNLTYYKDLGYTEDQIKSDEFQSILRNNARAIWVADVNVKVKTKIKDTSKLAIGFLTENGSWKAQYVNTEEIKNDNGSSFDILKYYDGKTFTFTATDNNKPVTVYPSTLLKSNTVYGDVSPHLVVNNTQYCIQRYTPILNEEYKNIKFANSEEWTDVYVGMLMVPNTKTKGKGSYVGSFELRYQLMDENTSLQ